MDPIAALLEVLKDSPDNASGFRENIDVNDVYFDSHLMWPTSQKLRFVAGADALFANGEAKGAVFTYTAPLDGSTAPAVPEPTVLDRDAEARRLFLGGYGSVEWQPVERFTLSGGLRLNATSERRGEGETTTNTRLSGSVGALFGVWESGVDHKFMQAPQYYTIFTFTSRAQAITQGKEGVKEV